MKTSPSLELCPNCAAEADQSRIADHRGEWGEADEVVICNNCDTTYGHAVTVGYFVEAYEAPERSTK